jgi:hypothetical protein
MQSPLAFSVKNNTFSDQINYQQLGFSKEGLVDESENSINYHAAILDINQVGPSLDI